jgi:hypothetical protein
LEVIERTGGATIISRPDKDGAVVGVLALLNNNLKQKRLFRYEMVLLATFFCVHLVYFCISFSYPVYSNLAFFLHLVSQQIDRPIESTSGKLQGLHDLKRLLPRLQPGYVRGGEETNDANAAQSLATPPVLITGVQYGEFEAGPEHHEKSSKSYFACDTYRGIQCTLLGCAS